MSEGGRGLLRKTLAGAALLVVADRAGQAALRGERAPATPSIYGLASWPAENVLA